MSYIDTCTSLRCKENAPCHVVFDYEYEESGKIFTEDFYKSEEASVIVDKRWHYIPVIKAALIMQHCTTAPINVWDANHASDTLDAIIRFENGAKTERERALVKACMDAIKREGRVDWLFWCARYPERYAKICVQCQYADLRAEHGENALRIRSIDDSYKYTYGNRKSDKPIPSWLEEGEELPF